MYESSLYHYLHKNHSDLKLHYVLKFAIDICKGMTYLHQNNIIHRDLKTANLLLDVNKIVKVADCGTARFQNQGGMMTAETGIYRWMAPEVINHQPYNQKSDIFSFAIVLWELMTAKVPYDTMTPLQASLGVRQGCRAELPVNKHHTVSHIMQRCWDSEPSVTDLISRSLPSNMNNYEKKFRIHLTLQQKTKLLVQSLELYKLQWGICLDATLGEWLQVLFTKLSIPSQGYR